MGHRVISLFMGLVLTWIFDLKDWLTYSSKKVGKSWLSVIFVDVLLVGIIRQAADVDLAFWIHPGTHCGCLFWLLLSEIGYLQFKHSHKPWSKSSKSTHKLWSSKFSLLVCTNYSAAMFSLKMATPRQQRLIGELSKVARQSKTTRGSFRVYACALIRSAGPTLLVGPIMLEMKTESVREQGVKTTSWSSGCYVCHYPCNVLHD